MAFDSAGNLFVAAGRYDHAVLMVTPAGVVTTFASTLPDCGNPYNMAFNSQGALFVACGSFGVLKIIPSGTVSVFATDLGTPIDFAVGSDDTLFVGDFSGTIYTLSPSGESAVFATGLQGIVGLAFDSDGALYVTQRSAGNVIKLSPPTPEEQKEQTLEQLNSIYPTGDKKVDKKLDKAIEHLEKSLDVDLWEDDLHLTKKGNKVFSEEKNAVHELMKIVKGGGEYSDDAQVAIDSLLGADQLLAQTGYDEAQAYAGDSKVDKELEKYNKEFEKVGEELAKGHYDHAIDHYKKAWEHAQHALKHAQ